MISSLFILISFVHFLRFLRKLLKFALHTIQLFLASNVVLNSVFSFPYRCHLPYPPVVNSLNLFLSHLRNFNGLLGEANGHLARCLLKLGLNHFILEICCIH